MVKIFGTTLFLFAGVFYIYFRQSDSTEIYYYSKINEYTIADLSPLVKEEFEIGKTFNDFFQRENTDSLQTNGTLQLLKFLYLEDNDGHSFSMNDFSFFYREKKIFLTLKNNQKFTCAI